MTRAVQSKSRRQPKQVGNVLVHHGNAAELNTFEHFRAGHEIARPGLTADGKRVFTTPSGKTFVTRKLSS